MITGKSTSLELVYAPTKDDRSAALEQDPLGVASGSIVQHTDNRILLTLGHFPYHTSLCFIKHATKGDNKSYSSKSIKEFVHSYNIVVKEFYASFQSTILSYDS